MASLIRVRTIVKNKIHAQLLKHGIRSKEVSPFTKAYSAKLRAIGR
jgi:hypothetical protein